MRTVQVLFLGALAACSDPEPDPLNPCREASTSETSCLNTCGNGELDRCWRFQSRECVAIESLVETCDGPMIATCDQLGYFGGTATCGSACLVDESTCDPCAIGVACTRHDIRIEDAVPSGARTALVDNSGLIIVEGESEIARTSMDGPVMGVVAVPGGWIVAHGRQDRLQVTAVDANGTRTQSGAAPAGLEPADPSRLGGFQMVRGPGDRVLIASVVWESSVQVVQYFVVDASGTIVDMGGELFDADTRSLGVTTDGTAFFVASRGRLARIESDGTRTITNLFPTSTEPTPSLHLAWTSDGGWYIVAIAENTYSVQRFDATGTRVGASSVVTPDIAIADVEADGEDLILLGFQTASPPAAAKLALVRVASDGSVGAARQIGAGDRSSPTFANRHDGDLLIRWETAWATYLAIESPVNVP